MKIRDTMVSPMLASVVVLLGLAGTAATVGGLRAEQDDNAVQLMDRRAALANEAVATESDRYVALLNAVAAGLATHDAMTRADFEAATDPLARARLAGATEVGFVVSSSVAQIPATQRLWRDRGAAGLTSRADPGGGEQFLPIFRRPVRPDGGNGRGPANLSAPPESRSALQKARRTNHPTVSNTYVLMPDRTLPAKDQKLAFTFAAPIRRPGGDQRFQGWLVLSMRGEEFLDGVLPRISQDQLNAQLFDTTGTDAVRVASYAVPGGRDLSSATSIAVADQQWMLVVEADVERLPGATSSLPTVVLIGGSLMTLLAAGLVQVLAAGRERARRAAADIGRAEAESRRQAGLLSAVMTSLCDGVGVVDETGGFLLQNPAAQDLFGIRGDAGGPDNWQRHFGLFAPDGQKPFPIEEMPLVRALRGEASDAVEMVVRNPVRPEGILISVSGRPLDPGAGQRGAVAVFHDITELRRYENDLAVFAGVVAHDLKAPLAVISGHCELAGCALDDDEPQEVRNALAGMTRTAFRMGGMIDTLLAYTTARDAALHITSVDMDALVADVVQGRVSHLTENERPEIRLASLPMVPADAAMLRHVLDNLIGNALKYVRPGTVAHVEVRTGAAPEGWARFEVADRGIGIPDEHKPAVFERFHRAHVDSGYAGTGLGLAICQRIVQRHGGDIAVADNPGGGSCFHFTLPLSIP